MTDPDLTPSPPTGGATSVMFDEVRRERGTAGTRRSRLLRGLGLVVFALAAWLISRNISWQDEVRVEARSGAETLVIQGSIESDWRQSRREFLIYKVEGLSR